MSRRAKSTPFNVIRPSPGCRNLGVICASVVLPAPLGPTIAKVCPVEASKLTASRARRPSG